jgi:molybdopterin-guanine dinucleotide biosynthesis protein A
MGRDKATLPFGRTTLLERVLARLAPVVEEVVLVSRRDQALPPLPPGIRHAHDPVEDLGPLGGLLPGLAASTADVVFLTGCDTPFLVPAFVELLFARLGAADVAVPEAEGFVHPLAAVYRVGVRPEVERLLAAERLRPAHLYERVATVRVPEADLRAVDARLDSLRNLNTPEAYAAALAELEA